MPDQILHSAHQPMILRAARLRATAPENRSAIVVPLLVAVLMLITAAAYHAIPDLPLAQQSDEPKKAHFVITGSQDFLHPILMLQVVRFANFFFGHGDVIAVVGLGRAVAAVFGALTVGATVLLARRIVGEWMALAAGILAAVAPLLAFHAQLFKEDVFVAPWLLLAITALDRLRERPGIGRAATFGALTGLAAASKYIGVIALPLAFLAPLVVSVSGSLTRYYGNLALAAAAGLVTFICINAPALVAPSVLVKGLNTEIHHALTGHIIIWRGWDSHFLFHWETSLLPGVGPLIAIAALAGAALAIKDSRSSHARHPPCPRVRRSPGICSMSYHR